MPPIRPVGHEDRLSLIEHLDELRSRLIVCLVGFLIAFSVAVWQNHALLDIVNRPLERTTAATAKKASGPLEQTARSQVRLRRALERGADAFERLGELALAHRAPTAPPCGRRSAPTARPPGHCPTPCRTASRSPSA